jgi:hypothetical protein
MDFEIEQVLICEHRIKRYNKRIDEIEKNRSDIINSWTYEKWKEYASEKYKELKGGLIKNG